MTDEGKTVTGSFSVEFNRARLDEDGGLEELSMLLVRKGMEIAAEVIRKIEVEGPPEEWWHGLRETLANRILETRTINLVDSTGWSRAEDQED